MNIELRKWMLVLAMVFATLQAVAQEQLTGRIMDEDGYPVSHASVQYKGHKIAAMSDDEGKFSIERHNGWTLSVSALSYKTQNFKITAATSFLEVKLKDDSHRISEVVVKSKKESTAVRTIRLWN